MVLNDIEWLNQKYDIHDIHDIHGFFGEYRFLSNFHKIDIEYNGKIYPTSEHAYQAAKTLDDDVSEQIRLCDTPSKSKALGMKVQLRSDWEQVKPGIMEEILNIKFSDPLLKKRLKNTAPGQLVEDNNWGDVYWGVCDGIGENNLGKILMKIRDLHCVDPITEIQFTLI